MARVAEHRRQGATRRAARLARREARQALPRSWIEVETSARLAVRSGLHLEDFLRFRLARYAARLPVPLESLPFDVGVEDGEPVVRMRTARPAKTAAAPEPPPAVREAAAAVARCTERAATARARADQLTREIADDLAAGRLPGRPDAVDASPEQRGRPPVPHPAPLLALRAIVLLLVVAAAYRLACPALLAAGLPTGDLTGAFGTAPFAAGLSMLFGLAAAVAMVAFLDQAVDRARELFDGATPERRHRLVGAAGGGALALATLVVLSAVLPGPVGEPLLLVVVPLAAVLVARRASALQAGRAAVAAAALEWDRARARDATERARRGECLTAAETGRAEAEAALAEACRQLRAVEQGAAESAQAEAQEAAMARRRLERLGESLASALEIDRYVFLRRAALASAQQGIVRRPLRPQRVEAERLGVAG
jgi:hypothetical protein